jgi:membrane-associated protease RseP (regulator of RpoE activity)
MPDITTVLSEDTDYKGAEWSLNGSPTSEAEFDSGFTMHKLNGKKTPTWANLQTKLKVMQAAYDALAYARSRKEEYDQLNQFELISDDSINGTTTHKDVILAIKAKYPKE